MNAPFPFGDYELLEVIGGGMSVVYRARRRGEQDDVAIKLLRQERMLDGDARARFARELAALRRVRHPAICPLLDAGEVDGMPFLCMPLLGGSNLATRIEQARERGETTDWRKAVAWIATIAEALQVAHDQGLVHRDVKPSNIFLDDADTPYLLDFGLARLEADRFRHLTRTGQVIGTPTYLSPEQLEARRGTVDGRADVYGLGATLFELLTLAPPFSAGTRSELYERILEGPPPEVSSHWPEVPAGLAEVVAVAMSKAARHRQPSAAEFAADLHRVARGEPPRWRRQPWPRRAASVLRRNAAAILASATAVALGSYALHLLAEQRVLAQVREFAVSGEQIRRSRERVLLADFDALPAPWHGGEALLREWLDRARPHAGGAPFDPAVLAVDSPAARALAVRRHALVRAIADAEHRLGVFDAQTQAAAPHADAWRRAAAALAADARFPDPLQPQLGLLPLGADPDSGLQEFLHLASHAPEAPLPDRDAAGHLRLASGHGIVFVLIPGGTARSALDGATARLASFFLAKHELTRSQHRRLDGGYDPSEWPLVRVANGEQQTLQHPVDNVRFPEVRALLRRWGLDLPTDLQFDWVATGCGAAPAAPRGPENCTGHEDGFHLNAPVGSFPPGPCGLHDLFGNVGELTRDEFAQFALTLGAGDGLRSPGNANAMRTIRGGWHIGKPWPLDMRGQLLVDQSLPQVGVRPVRSLEER